MRQLVDSFGREVTYLRVSLTDRCNLRCFYCRPRQVAFCHRSEILSFEEIERVLAVAVQLGVRKIRLTGGEPLVRPGVVDLVCRIAALPGLRDLAMSTNGILLGEMADAIKTAGLHRLNISLDTLSPETFQRISGTDDLDKILRGIHAAAAVGFARLKLNVVVIRGMNDDELEDLVRFGQSVKAQVRFIEYMPMSGDPKWKARHVAREEIVDRLRALLAADVPRIDGRDPAVYYPLRGGAGEVGVISPISCRFCDLCNRLRLTADGHLRPCLTSRGEVDVKGFLRQGAGEEALAALFRRATEAKPQQGVYTEEGSERPMVAIGG